VARAYAQTFTEAELQQAVTFQESAIGQKMQRANVLQSMGDGVLFTEISLGKETRNQFYRHRACGPSILDAFAPESTQPSPSQP
jgi:hypothetical protein